MVHLMRYIRDNNNLGFLYYSKIEDTPLTYILGQAIINSENQFIVFYDSRWQECLDTVSSTGAYILFYQGGPIDHYTHVMAHLIMS